MKKGIALLTVLIIALALFVVVGAFLYLATQSRRLNARYNENLNALGLAEAGADYAVWEINFSDGDFTAAEGWTGTNPKETTITDFEDPDGNVLGDIEISVYNPGTDIVTVISTGRYIPTITGPTAERKIRVLLGPHDLFDYAILASETITLVGDAVVDSYDSSQGPYDPSNPGDNGNIVTNGDGDPAIITDGNASVGGNAYTGPGGTVSQEGSSDISGETDDTADIFIPPVIVPDTLQNLLSSGDIALVGHQSLELTTGDYKYNSLDLSGHGILILNGDVNLYLTLNPSIDTDAQSQLIVRNGAANIYFDGDVSIAGNGVSNEGGDPSDLTFYGTDSVSSIELSGIGTFYGTFYAPSADFDISGSSAIYGAIVGEDVLVRGDAEIHYDENLQIDGPTIGYDPYAWQEK